MVAEVSEGQKAEQAAAAKAKVDADPEIASKIAKAKRGWKSELLSLLRAWNSVSYLEKVEGVFFLKQCMIQN